MKAEKVLYKPHDKKKVPLVTGAAGSIGINYLKRIAETTKVIGMVHSDKDFKRISKIENVIPAKCDMSDIKNLEKLFRKVDTVFHLAAILSSNDKEIFYKVNVEGTKNLAEAANKSGVRHVHLVSSVAIYGKQNKNPIVEIMPHNSKDPYGDSKFEQEKIIFNKKNLFSGSSVRPVNVLGPNIDVWTHFILNLINGIPVTENLKNEKLKKISKSLGIRNIKLPLFLITSLLDRAWFSYIEIDNLIDLSLLSVSNRKANGEVFNAVDGRTTWGELIRDYSSGVFKKRIYKVPSVVLNPILDLFSAATFLIGNILRMGTFIKLSQYLGSGGVTYSSSKAEKILGFKHSKKIPQSILETSEFVKEKGIISSKMLYHNK